MYPELDESGFCFLSEILQSVTGTHKLFVSLGFANLVQLATLPISDKSKGFDLRVHDECMALLVCVILHQTTAQTSLVSTSLSNISVTSKPVAWASSSISESKIELSVKSPSTLNWFVFGFHNWVLIWDWSTICASVEVTQLL